jgi:hypothetical protein
LLDEKNISIRWRVFMTATERRYQGSSDKILSMDDPEIYGETFDLITFKEAIQARQPILCDYEVLVIAIGQREIAELIDEGTFVDPDLGGWRVIDAATPASVVALRSTVPSRASARAPSRAPEKLEIVPERVSKPRLGASSPGSGLTVGRLRLDPLGLAGIGLVSPQQLGIVDNGNRVAPQGVGRPGWRMHRSRFRLARSLGGVGRRHSARRPSLDDQHARHLDDHDDTRRNDKRRAHLQ